MHLNLHQKESDGRRAKLNGPGEDPYDTSNDEHTVPVPKKGKYLMNNGNVADAGNDVYHYII